jgi:hypothetical protein
MTIDQYKEFSAKIYRSAEGAGWSSDLDWILRFSTMDVSELGTLLSRTCSYCGREGDIRIRWSLQCGQRVTGGVYTCLQNDRECQVIRTFS